MECCQRQRENREPRDPGYMSGYSEVTKETSPIWRNNKLIGYAGNSLSKIEFQSQARQTK